MGRLQTPRASPVESLTIGATVTAAFAILALFLPYPGSAGLVYYDRAKGLFDDPTSLGRS